MSGSGPKLVLNRAGVVAPNTLLVVRLSPVAEQRGIDASARVVAWHTSLTALSGELEGHSLGGGMLKWRSREAWDQRKSTRRGVITHCDDLSPNGMLR